MILNGFRENEPSAKDHCFKLTSERYCAFMLHGTGIKPSHSPAQFASTRSSCIPMNPVNPLRPGFPRHKKSSSGGIIMTIVLVLALAAGGVTYHQIGRASCRERV